MLSSNVCGGDRRRCMTRPRSYAGPKPQVGVSSDPTTPADARLFPSVLINRTTATQITAPAEIGHPAFTRPHPLGVLDLARNSQAVTASQGLPFGGRYCARLAPAFHRHGAAVAALRRAGRSPRAIPALDQGEDRMSPAMTGQRGCLDEGNLATLATTASGSARTTTISRG
jgi:hypothetical protein